MGGLKSLVSVMLPAGRARRPDRTWAWDLGRCTRLAVVGQLHSCFACSHSRHFSFLGLSVANPSESLGRCITVVLVKRMETIAPHYDLPCSLALTFDNSLHTEVL